MSLFRTAAFAAAIACAAFVLRAPAIAQDASPFSEAEKEAIGEIIRDYLVANPEVMIEVMDALDAQEAERDRVETAAAIAKHREALENDGYSYVAGNPDGEITVVEFFDYRCPYCKQSAEDVKEIIRKHDDVRLVLKEFPVLGPESRVASRAAIAAIPQDRYLAFHFAMLENEGTLDEERIMEIAEDVGLDTERLARDMESARIEEIIKTNREIAFDIGVRGTPAYVIGDTLVPGAAPLEEIEARIDEARDAAG